MGRKKWVTREFKKFTVQGSIYDENTGENTTFTSEYINSVFDKKDATKYFESELEEGMHITFIKAIGYTPIMIGMAEQEFCDTAVELDPRTRKPLESEEE